MYILKILYKFKYYIVFVINDQNKIKIEKKNCHLKDI